MNYQVTIGIEMHVELKSNTKMFSSAPIVFGTAPNTSVTAVDMAFPGTLPTVNERAIVLALRACYGLNATIDSLIKFDRKNYYYSDLPKGYQITQQFYPIGTAGLVTLRNGNKVRVNRLHMEEDTAKQFHYPNQTLLDYNRAGNPLIEIVSEPDLSNANDAVEYIEQISQILKYLDVSNVKMEEGSMRCDVNISLRPFGYPKLGSKVEIKNLNSLNNIAKSIEYEIKRQSSLLNSGDVVLAETRRFDEQHQITVLMRNKDETVDYKYFPEPNIFPIKLSDEFAADVKSNLPELASERLARYLNLQMNDYDANVIINNKELSDFFNEVIKNTEDIKAASNWVISDVLGYVNKQAIGIEQLQLKPEQLAEMINMINEGVISSKQAKQVFEEIVKGSDARQVAKELGLELISDEGQIMAFITKAIADNPQSVEDYRAGRDKAIGFLIGQIMKASQGKVDPGLTNKLLKQQLESMV